MKAAVARAALLGALALSAAPLAAPSQATCVEPLAVACRAVCPVHPVTFRLCTVT